ncbi:MAG: hypothetical protein WBG43_07655 [Marinifilaceae bacterium]
MKFDFLIPYINILAYFFAGLLILYIRTLIVEKAKIRALRNKNKILIEESEEIKSKYNKEIEGIKKEHQLDIEKRKYQYESKKEHYINFFKLLDDFSASSTVEMQKKMMPILDEFNRNYFTAACNNNKEGETHATTVLSKKTQKLIFEGNTEFTRIKQETNTIRIIASDSILKTLDLLELAYGRSLEESSVIMNNLQVHMMTNDQEGMAKDQRKMQAIANVILKYKNELIKRMRVELNEI